MLVLTDFNQKLKYLCDRYNIKYKIFHQTDIILLDTGLDEWKIKKTNSKNKPYCLLHKNKTRLKNKYHTQRKTNTLFQAIDIIIKHKNVLYKLYNSKYNQSQQHTCNNCNNILNNY